MKQFAGHGNNRKQAYTLMEMMIAVIIIGVLVAIAVPSIAKVRETARIKQAQGELAIIAAAVRQLAWDTGKWPGGAARNLFTSDEVWDLTTAKAGLLTSDSATFPLNWQGPYIRKIPLDPWGNKYFFDPDYTISGTFRVVVGSFGPNKVGPNLYDKDDIYVRLDD